jgi:single-stranded-DNA-specific exonuclease
MEPLRVKPRIERRQPADAALSALSALDGLLGRIYANRGVRSPEELDLSLAGLLPPSLLGGLEPAAALLDQALREQWRLLIVGDFDADGATGTALAVRGLRALGFRQVAFLAPDRFRYGYGLSPAIVAMALEQQPDLLLTVDNGVSSIAGVAAAKAAGLRVLVTDHHLPGAELPAAEVLVNPNLDGEAFPSKALAGVGVVFYLLLALRARLRQQGQFAGGGEPRLAEFLDLVALGTVADVVPLDRNNRILVAQGLARLRTGRGNPGIQALLQVAGRDPARLTASDLGFAVGPRLNAAGRLEDMGLGIACLLADEPAEALRLALELDRLNRERRGIESDMQLEAEQILEEMPRQDANRWPQGLCLRGEDWHQGVVGILASRVKERLHRPVIAFAPAGDGRLKGSGRSIEGLHLRDTLVSMAARHPGLIQRFGGHAMAAGLTIEADAFDSFSQAFDQEVRGRLGDEGVEPVLHTDGELTPERFNLETAYLLRQAGPWGQHFPEPLFDGRFRVLERRLVGERHLKLRLQGEGQVLDAIGFFLGDYIELPADEVRAVYRLDINDYRGEQNLQLHLLHLEAIA